jgi:FlaA1/EpsC-like NDP-sugar epimerase
MTNIMIFGAGILAKKYYYQIKDNEDMNVLNFIDNDKIKQGSLIDGIEVVSPK